MQPPGKRDHMGLAATNAYKNGYIKENYDRVNLTLPKGKKAEVDEYQKAHGFRSVNDFIAAAIQEAMEYQMTKAADGHIFYLENASEHS